MLAVASLKRSLEFDPVEQGVKRKRAELKLPTTTTSFTLNNTPSSPSKQSSIFTSSPINKQAIKSSSLSSISSSPSSTADDKPMFTYIQTAQMCARLLREQDKSIREQYEQLLATKRNEQYEQFVIYSHDNIHRNSSKEKLVHFSQPQESDQTSIEDLSYIS
ncbi:unnamed protein product [Adineta ricciae]|uniref:Akirin n=1 Tax=Adineta ricciae TaxID=249248 RepID=A0A813VC33_ADIRI|nr:unnamed protein product [Adineta ricciae]CAF1410341.1 unnamed protein product [Adineta ricciae]